MDALKSDRPRRTEPGTGLDPRRFRATRACCCTSPAGHESKKVGCVIVVVIEPGEEDREALIRARFLSGGTGHVALSAWTRFWRPARIRVPEPAPGLRRSAPAEGFRGRIEAEQGSKMPTQG